MESRSPKTLTSSFLFSLFVSALLVVAPPALAIDPIGAPQGATVSFDSVQLSGGGRGQLGDAVSRLRAHSPNGHQLTMTVHDQGGSSGCFADLQTPKADGSGSISLTLQGCGQLQGRRDGASTVIRIPVVNPAGGPPSPPLELRVVSSDSPSAEKSLKELRDAGLLVLVDEESVSPQEQAIEAFLLIPGVGHRFMTTITQDIPSLQFTKQDGGAVSARESDSWFSGVVNRKFLAEYFERETSRDLVDALLGSREVHDETRRASDQRAPNARRKRNRPHEEMSVSDIPEDLFEAMASDLTQSEEFVESIESIGPIDEGVEGGFKCMTRQIVPREIVSDETEHSGMMMLDERVSRHGLHTPTVRSLMRGSMDLTEEEKGDEFFNTRSRFNNIELKVQFVVHKAKDDTDDDIWGQSEIDVIVDRLNADYREFGISFAEQKPFVSYDIETKFGLKTMDSNHAKAKAKTTEINTELNYVTSKLIVIHILRNFVRDDGPTFKGGCGGEAAFPYLSEEFQVQWDHTGAMINMEISDWGKPSYLTQIDESCLLSPWVASHEVGHMLGLYHPFDSDVFEDEHLRNRYTNNHVDQGTKPRSSCKKDAVLDDKDEEKVDYWNIMNYIECGTAKEVKVNDNLRYEWSGYNSFGDAFSVNVVKRFTPGQADRARHVMKFVETKHPGAFGITTVSKDVHERAEAFLARSIVHNSGMKDSDSEDEAIGDGTWSGAGNFYNAYQTHHDLSSSVWTDSRGRKARLNKEESELGLLLSELQFYNFNTENRDAGKAHDIYKDIIKKAKEIVDAADKAEEEAEAKEKEDVDAK